MRTVEKITEEARTTDKNTALILNQLSMERNAYDLMVKLLDSDELAQKTEVQF